MDGVWARGPKPVREECCCGCLLLSAVQTALLVSEPHVFLASMWLLPLVPSLAFTVILGYHPLYSHSLGEVQTSLFHPLAAPWGREQLLCIFLEAEMGDPGYRMQVNLNTCRKQLALDTWSYWDTEG